VKHRTDIPESRCGRSHQAAAQYHPSVINTYQFVWTVLPLLSHLIHTLWECDRGMFLMGDCRRARDLDIHLFAGLIQNNILFQDLISFVFVLETSYTLPLPFPPRFPAV